jgi:glycosyltransferase involved in cell wall biosynthesis
MSQSPLRVVYLSPGAGGMYCGSCLSDNMLVQALRRQGVEMMLVPLYTPLKTEEPDQSIPQVFFGGLSVYLRQLLPWGDRMPGVLSRWLDRPALLKMLSRRAIRTDARRLGALTLSMVRGEHGRQRMEVARLVDWLKSQPRPDVMNLGNFLISGCVPVLKRELGVPIVVTLQGDDLFLDDLPPAIRVEVEAELRQIAREVDAFIVHSRYYAEEMRNRFGIPTELIHVVPLGISLPPLAFTEVPEERTATANRPPTVGFLARICPAKGLHILVDALIALREMPAMERARLRVAGWVGPDDEAYLRQQQQRLVNAGHQDAFELQRAPSWEEKRAFLRTIDVLSVPTTYREPKGRYLLESLAAGVPVVQPRHGAFPEIVARTGGGELFEPGDAAALAATLYGLLADPQRRLALGEQGRKGVSEHHTDAHAATATLAVYQRVQTGRK